MSLKLQVERLRVQDHKAEGSTQTVVEGSVSLPAGQAEIGRALRVWGEPRVRRAAASEDKVLIEGVLDLHLLYAAISEADPHSIEEDGYDDIRPAETLERVDWDESLTFTCLVDVPGAEDGGDADAEVRVHGCQFEVRGDRETVDVDIVLDVRAAVAAGHEQLLTTGVAGEGIRAETDEIRLRRSVGHGRAEVHVEADLAPDAPAPIEKILLVEPRPTVDEVIPAAGGVQVRGRTDWGVLWTTASGPQFREWFGETRFESEVRADGFSSGLDYVARAVCAAATCVPVDTGGAQQLRIEAVLDVTVEAARIQRVQAVRDIAADDVEIAQRKVQLQVREAVGEASSRAEVDGVLELPSQEPAVDRVLTAWGRAELEDVHVLGDRVLLEGCIDLTMLYVTRGDGEAHTVRWARGPSFETEIPLPGAEPGLERHVEAEVVRLTCDPINRETIEVRATLAAHAALGRARELEAVVEAVEVPAAVERPPTFTFIIVQEGDSLWRLARTYHTTEDAIRAVNSEFSEAALRVGERLCIPRRLPTAAPDEATPA